MLNYKTFINFKSKYFRQALVYLLILQGVNFYAFGYQVELMNNGFSKETLNTIDNLLMFPLLVITYFFSSLKTSSRKLFYMRTMLCLRLAWQIVGFMIPYHTNWSIAAYSFVSNCMAWMIYIIDMNTSNSFPLSALSGMFVTVLYSCRNLGNNGTIHLKIISWIGFSPAVMIGFAYTGLMILLLPKIVKWVDEGSI